MSMKVMPPKKYSCVWCLPFVDKVSGRGTRCKHMRTFVATQAS